MTGLEGGLFSSHAAFFLYIPAVETERKMIHLMFIHCSSCHDVLIVQVRVMRLARVPISALVLYAEVCYGVV
jgi:hypothetical protein